MKSEERDSKVKLIFVIIAAILFCVAAIFNATMDNIDHHYYKSVFSTFESEQYFNPSVSWTNKYIDHKVENGFIQWCIGPLCIDKPVIFTDFWHFVKGSFIFCLALGMSFLIIAAHDPLPKYLYFLF